MSSENHNAGYGQAWQGKGPDQHGGPHPAAPNVVANVVHGPFPTQQHPLKLKLGNDWKVVKRAHKLGFTQHR